MADDDDDDEPHGQSRPKVASWKLSLAATGATKGGGVSKGVSRVPDAHKARPAPVYEEDDEEEEQDEEEQDRQQEEQQRKKQQAKGGAGRSAGVKEQPSQHRAAARDLRNDFAEDQEDDDSVDEIEEPAPRHHPNSKAHHGQANGSSHKGQGHSTGRAPASDSDEEEQVTSGEDEDEEGEQERYVKPPPAYSMLSRARNADSLTTWAEVDESELAMVAEKLVQSVNKSTQSEDVLAKVRWTCCEASSYMNVN